MFITIHQKSAVVVRYTNNCASKADRSVDASGQASGACKVVHLLAELI